MQNIYKKRSLDQKKGGGGYPQLCVQNLYKSKPGNTYFIEFFRGISGVLFWGYFWGSMGVKKKRRRDLYYLDNNKNRISTWKKVAKSQSALQQFKYL